jgi:hypothetical protein
MKDTEEAIRYHLERQLEYGKWGDSIADTTFLSVFAFWNFIYFYHPVNFIFYLLGFC